MKIVADENIPYVKDIFSAFGEVILSSGRNINNKMLKGADVLLVRSITKVNEELLGGTELKFVATATIGIDHVDTEYLKKKGIGFASAPGSNADSVAEYVITAISILADKYSFNIENKKIGIIGVGNVGSRVEKRAKILGMIPLLNDPPKKRETNDNKYLTLDQILNEADIVTLHVPLNKSGNDATYHLVNNEFLRKMKKGSFLINTSRGMVHDEESIKTNRNKLGGLVLDVWENEPDINIETLKLADIATPHIAGYSFDGKVRGTCMIFDAVSSFFSLNEKVNEDSYLKMDDVNSKIDLSMSSNLIFDALRTAYPIVNDDKNTREIISFESEKRAKYFDELRKNYPVRREFKNFSINCNKNTPKTQIDILEKLGFKVIQK